MKYEPIVTNRFMIFSHEIPRPETLGGLSRTVFQAWFHSLDIPKPVCVVTINESFLDYVEWISVDEKHRRKRVATEVIQAIEVLIPGLYMEGVTKAGIEFCNHYEQSIHGLRTP